jgi:Galactose oxidase, central domain
MIPYDKKLVVFGGAGGYLTAIKMRMSYNDVHIFDTDTETWLKEPEIEGAPSKRTNHTASILGGIMLVHGGYNTEQKKTMNDFGFFDLERQKWILHKVFTQPDPNAKAHRIDDKHFPYDQPTDDSVIGFRQMHTMNAIFDQEYYDDMYKGNRLRQRRGMWIRERIFSHEEVVKGHNFEEGIYLFGGVD